MTTYRITAPDGTKFKVNAPEGATEQEALSYAQEQFSQQSKDWEGSTNQEKKPFSAVETLKNVPGSAFNFAKGLVSGTVGAIAHPADTAKSLLLTAEGGMRNLAPGMAESFDSSNPFLKRRAGATGADAKQMADAVGDFYTKQYGGAENIKETLQKDPVSLLADASMLFGVGGAAAPARISKVLSTASKATNPLSVLSPVLGVIGSAAKSGLGLTTGVGAETIGQAAKAGYVGDTSFLKNMTGETPITDVLDSAKAGLEKMRQQKSAEYRQGMSGVSKDKTVLDFQGIDQALGDAAQTVTYKGQVKNAKAAQAVQKMADDVAEWKALDPKEFHTPEGLDALKQKIGATMEAIPFEERTARLAAGKVYNAVKAEIQKQAPTYAKTMQDYSAASDQIGEIERALSIGDKAAKDTAIRKLQSLTRNNVNTNYGSRLDLAKTLEQQGGVSLLPSLAGQAMNSLAPRGLIGQAGAYGTAAAALANPYSLLMLPLQSPRVAGASLYGLGRAAGATGGLFGKAGINADRARMAGLLEYELGK